MGSQERESWALRSCVLSIVQERNALVRKGGLKRADGIVELCSGCNRETQGLKPSSAEHREEPKSLVWAKRLHGCPTIFFRKSGNKLLVFFSGFRRDIGGKICLKREGDFHVVKEKYAYTMKQKGLPLSWREKDDQQNVEHLDGKWSIPMLCL
ncbi:hypothetical protein QQP08_013865 [Theobroma cacao]|nr:hypothetical protein QQP08_013865 [Theobroma cacao]